MIPKHAIRSKTKGVGGDTSIFTFIFRSPVKSVYHRRSLLGEARVLKTPPATQTKTHAFPEAIVRGEMHETEKNMRQQAWPWPLWT